MTIRITLHGTARNGVDFNKDYETFFEDFVPNGSPEFLGPDDDETTQIAHIATPEEGREAQARAVLLDGRDFLYTFSNHTVSGEIDTISLVTLGRAYDSDTGDLVLDGGIITAARPLITFADLDLSNPAGETGPVHDIVAGMMGGGPSGSLADPGAITDAIFGEAHRVTGSSGADRYAGTKFGDVIRGMEGRDVLSGRGGDDTIAGGRDQDAMAGGGGADTFVFSSLAEVRGDTIRDFDASDGDRIMLRAIDADTGARGNQTFSFVGEDRFSGEAGELRYTANADRTVLMGDVDGDGSADFRLLLAQDAVLTEAGILL